MKFLTYSLIALPFMVVLDMLWFGGIASSFYKSQIGVLMHLVDGSLMPRWTAAVIMYALMALSVGVFTVSPGIGASTLKAFGYGAIFGLFLYGMYNMTNLAILDKWTWKLALVDTVWGTFLFGIVTLIVTRIVAHFKI